MSEHATLTVIAPAAIGARMTEAETDGALVNSWLSSTANKSQATWKAYDHTQAQFRAFVGKPLRAVSVEDFQRFRDSLGRDYAESSLAVIVARVKSLLSYGQRVGYLLFNVGKAIVVSQGKDTLAERIIDEQTVSEMIALEPNPRNKLMIRLAYASAGRVSEVVTLKWRDLAAGDDGAGVATIYGKGGKTRHVRIPAKLWADLERLAAGNDDPVFASRKKRTVRCGHLTPAQAWRIVQAAGLRVDPELRVTPHMLRHSHATHALRRGASLPVIQATLGHKDFKTTQRYARVNPKESSSDYLVIS